MRTTYGLALLLAASALACGGSSSSSSSSSGAPASDGGDACPAATTDRGHVSFTMSGLPATATADVLFTGPLGASHIPNVATLAEDYPTGTYTVTAPDVVVADAIVRAVYRATVSPASLCVRAGSPQSVTITYALVPTSHALWATNANAATEIVGFRADSLRASGAPAADVSSHVAIPSDAVFDKEGGFWTTRDEGGPRALVHVPASAFASSGDLTPDVEITGSSLNEGAPSAAGMAFDKEGNLWIAAPAAGKILRFAAADLRASGSPEPGVVVSGIHGTSALAFDKDGNLWTNDDANHVVEYAAARLAASTSSPPDVAVGAQSSLPVVTSYQAPSGLAFDKDGNLWVDFNGSDIVRLTPAERASSSTVTPGVQLKLDVTALADNMAFDESGGLWFAYSQGKLARLAPEQLAATATVSPSTILSSASVGSAGNVAFYPAPDALPLFAKP